MASRLRYSATSGAPFGIGNLSIEEMKRALHRLCGNAAAVSMDLTTAMFDPKPIILLYRSHYSLFFWNTSTTTRFIFDSFGSKHARKLLGIDTRGICNLWEYQDVTSDTCGLFTLLALHVLLRNPIINDIDSLTNDYLHAYITPVDFVHNEFVINIYCVNNKIGEEFDDKVKSIADPSFYSCVQNVLQLTFK